MVRAECARDEPRITEFVGLALGEPDREGFDWLADHAAHHGGDGRRIYATGKEHAERHVRHQAHAHRGAEKVHPLFYVMLVATASVVFVAVEGHVPVFVHPREAVVPQQRVSGKQSADAAEQGLLPER